MSEKAPNSDPTTEGYRAMGAAIRDTPARTLVNHLLTERGCGWDMLHLVTGVPVRHLRLWRGGEAPHAEAFTRLVEFADLLNTLDGAAGYPEPTQATAFMETRITRTPGYHRRPFDLYLLNHRDLLITLATCGDDIDREHALDNTIPGWRDTRSDYETEIATDGHPTLVRWRNT